MAASVEGILRNTLMLVLVLFGNSKDVVATHYYI